MLGLLLLVGGFKVGLPEPFAVVPQPKEVAIADSTGVLPAEIRSVALGPELWRLVLPYNLERLGSHRSGVRVSVSVGDLGLPGEEGYQLSVGDKAVSVKGESAAGAFYGLQTLSQLMEDASEAEVEIPAVTIRDWPDIPYRAVHFDTKHHLDTMDSYYEAIDRLANLKVNAIVWEFEDKLRYRRQPVVGASHAISIEQMQALTRYAARRFIEISPLVQGLGHASFILKHPEYEHLRDDLKSDWAFCPINEGSYEVLFDLYRDAIEATPGSRYLHIGGDEVNVGASELAKNSGLDPLDLHLHWLNRVNKFLKSEGRTVIMWDDMPLKHGGVYRSTHDRSFDQARAFALWSANREKLDQVVEKFPKDVVYMRWNYSRPGLPGNNMALDWYAEGGLTAMAATAAQTRWPLFPRNNGNVGPIREFCRMTAERGLDGILCTAWDDDSPHMAFYWRGWTVFADFSWSSEGRDEESALKAFAQRAYGIAAAEDALAGYSALEEAMNFWDTALITAGRRNVAQDATMNSIIDLPTLESREEWLEKHADRLASADLVLPKSMDSMVVAYGAWQKATRNHHELLLSSWLGNVQHWSNWMLRKLRDWAQDPSQDDIDWLHEIVELFNFSWSHFIDTYNDKRILNNPPGYILDQNHHAHQANSSNGPEWMVAV
ncbi:MAG: beta-N-acetylhexosaminidase, partial [Armatimonadetes bacterium]|nr:beta-N-acetylhexosaminidase [Armatimonadota bacterium]